jgi:hypothetical protein
MTKGEVMNRVLFAAVAAALLFVAQQGFACGAIAFNPDNHAWGVPTTTIWGKR